MASSPLVEKQLPQLGQTTSSEQGPSSRIAFRQCGQVERDILSFGGVRRMLGRGQETMQPLAIEIGGSFQVVLDARLGAMIHTVLDVQLDQLLQQRGADLGVHARGELQQIGAFSSLPASLKLIGQLVNRRGGRLGVGAGFAAGIHDAVPPRLSC